MAYADKRSLSPILILLMLFLLIALGGVVTLFAAMMGSILG